MSTVGMRHLMLDALIGKGFDYKIPEDRMLVLKMVMKYADVSNPAKPRGVYMKWTERVIREFYLQGDQEKALSQTTFVTSCSHFLVFGHARSLYYHHRTPLCSLLLRAMPPILPRMKCSKHHQFEFCFMFTIYPSGRFLVQV
jgi:hypothetical protein